MDEETRVGKRLSASDGTLTANSSIQSWTARYIELNGVIWISMLVDSHLCNSGAAGDSYSPHGND